MREGVGATLGVISVHLESHLPCVYTHHNEGTPVPGVPHTARVPHVNLPDTVDLYSAVVVRVSAVRWLALSVRPDEAAGTPLCQDLATPEDDAASRNGSHHFPLEGYVCVKPVHVSCLAEHPVLSHQDLRMRIVDAYVGVSAWLDAAFAPPQAKQAGWLRADQAHHLFH